MIAAPVSRDRPIFNPYRFGYSGFHEGVVVSVRLWPDLPTVRLTASAKTAVRRSLSEGGRRTPSIVKPTVDFSPSSDAGVE
jgi:hypothetical protein